MKNKFVTAVTTAGLLAGILGSAFVPSVKAGTGEDAVQTLDWTSEDKAATGTTAAFYLTTAYPSFTVVINPDDAAADDSTYGISVSGGTIRSCSIAAAGDSTASTVTKTTTTCDSTVDFVADTETATWTVTLNKLAAGATATVTLSDDSGTEAAAGNLNKATGRATSAGANVVNAAKSSASFGLDMNFDEATTAADVAANVIGGKNYFLPSALPHYSGDVLNADGVTLTTSDTVVIAEVTGGHTLGCAIGARTAVVADGGDALATVTVDTSVSSIYGCTVYNADDTVTSSYTLTVKTAAGVVVGSKTGAFLGEVKSLAVVAKTSRVATQADDIDDFLTITAKDAAGNAWGAKNTTTLTLTGAGVVDGEDAVLTVADGVGADTGVTSAAKGLFKLDNSAMCPADAEGTIAKLTVQTENTSEETISSNQISITCGADAASDLTISKIEIMDASPAPGAEVKARFYMEDEDGVAAGLGDTQTSVEVTLAGATNTDIDADDDIDTCTLVVDYCEVTLKASTVVGTAIVLTDPNSSATAKVFVTTDSYDNTVVLSGSRVTVDFGPSARYKKVTFLVEFASGTVRSYVRKANSLGKAVFSTGFRKVYITATFGDEISDTVYKK
jgi:hypothetical protein